MRTAIRTLSGASLCLLFATAVLRSTIVAQDARPAPKLETKLEAAHLRHGTKTVTALATSGDGKTLASSGEPGGVKIWDFASRQLVKTLDGPPEEWLALSSDGKRLAALRA